MATDEVDCALRPTVCPRCEYALAGLPAVGTCPECGRPYDGEAVYLYGYAKGLATDHWVRRPVRGWPLAWRWTWGTGLLAGIILLNLKMHGFVLGAVAASVVTRLIATAWWSKADIGSGVLRVRLGPDGVAQGGRGLGPIPYGVADRQKPVPWRKVKRVAVTEMAGGQVRIVVSNSDDPWRFRHDYVDAVVRCPPDAVAALRQRIAEWRAAADRR